MVGKEREGRRNKRESRVVMLVGVCVVCSDTERVNVCVCG
jgi:hypothetical protein